MASLSTGAHRVPCQQCRRIWLLPAGWTRCPACLADAPTPPAELDALDHADHLTARQEPTP